MQWQLRLSGIGGGGQKRNQSNSFDLLAKLDFTITERDPFKILQKLDPIYQIR